MNKNIYSVDDFEEYLSELSVGTEYAQKLTEFVRFKQKQVTTLNSRLMTAHSMIGELMLQERIDYE
jgi:hypothetical protein